VKWFFVGPLEKAKPKKLRLLRMLLRISGSVVQKSWAALLKNRDRRVRNESLGLDGQAQPIRKRSPLDEFSDGLGETVRLNQSAFILGKPL